MFLIVFCKHVFFFTLFYFHDQHIIIQRQSELLPSLGACRPSSVLCRLSSANFSHFNLLLCKFIKLFFQKHVLLVSHLSLLLCCVFIVLHPSSCHVHATIDIECLYLSLYHCNALVYENKESWILNLESWNPRFRKK